MTLRKCVVLNTLDLTSKKQDIVDSLFSEYLRVLNATLEKLPEAKSSTELHNLTYSTIKNTSFLLADTVEEARKDVWAKRKTVKNGFKHCSIRFSNRLFKFINTDRGNPCFKVTCSPRKTVAIPVKLDNQLNRLNTFLGDGWGFDNISLLSDNRIAVVLEKEFPDTVGKDFERQNQKALAAWEGLGEILQTTRPVKAFADLNGLKVRLGTDSGTLLYKAGGAVPVNMPAAEAYEAMSKGVAQGMASTIEAIDRYKIPEIAKHCTIGISGYPTYACYFLTINLDTWNRIPADIQKVMVDWGNETQFAWNAALKAMGDNLVGKFKAAGITFYDFPKADRDLLLKKVAVPLYEDYIKKLEGAGYPDARKILDRYCELVDYNPYKYK